jgi:hypothetical protein
LQSELAPYLDSEWNNRFVQPPNYAWQRWWSWLSERANPIVVKEARQSLNSRQFTLCFAITLIAVLTWTLFAIVIQLPQMYYVPGGQLMLSGFMVILAFPLLLVIPFSAFRSMVIESEERTFELVSISALSAGQIVNGKMFSAVLQSLVYLSTLTPCFVITYLLRGVALSSIIYYLLFTLLQSLLLTAIGIFVASVGRLKFLQVIASIFMLGLLLLVIIYWCAFSISTLVWWSSMGKFGPIVCCALASITAVLLPVLLRSATAAIDFPSENHALPLRIRMLLLIAVCMGWALWTTVVVEQEDFGIFMVVCFLILFLTAGAFVSSERGVLSMRAQRTLPTTLVGRLWMTWFYPGAGLGYLFLVSLYTSCQAAWIILGEVGITFPIEAKDIYFVDRLATGLFSWATSLDPSQLTTTALAAWSYFVFYSGLNRLLMMAIPKRIVGRMVIGPILQALVVLAGCLLPLTVVMLVNEFKPFDYGWHHALNIPWTLIEINTQAQSTLESVAIIFVLAALMLGINILLCGRDVMLVRVNLPERLQSELQENAQPTQPAPDPFA